MIPISFRLLLGRLALTLVACGALSLRAKEHPEPLELARQLNQAFVQLAEQVSPAVVVIRVAPRLGLDATDEDGTFWRFLPESFREKLEEEWEKRRRSQPDPDQEKPKEDGRRTSRTPRYTGQGSGIVIREDGYILTNRHVIEGAEKILVVLNDRSEYPGEIKGIDPMSDLAVIKIDASNLTAAKFGDSSKTRVGEFAVAIGAPFELDYSVTFGHVSAKDRNNLLPDRAMDEDFIQTDANINPGNSGGPLVNIEGEVIGINTLIRGLQTGIGFAIPSNLAREVSQKLITDGKYVRSWLGVGISALRADPDYRERLKPLKDGVIVTAIQAKSPAARSDLKAGDVILEVDGQPVATGPELKAAIRRKEPGSIVSLKVHRRTDELTQGDNLSIKVTTEAWPEPNFHIASSAPAPVPEVESKLGLTVKTLTPEMAEELGVESTEGVVVTEVEKGSVAESKALRPGDVITEVNHHPIASAKDFRSAMKGADLRKGVVLNFTTRGTSRFEILKESP